MPIPFGVTLELVVEQATAGVILLDGHQGHRAAFANLLAEGTARSEGAASRQSGQVGYVARDGLEAQLAHGNARPAIEQPLRVRVLRIFHHLVHGSLLHDAPGVHDGDATAKLGGHAQVVGDQDDGSAMLLVDTAHQIQDLGLDGDIQGGGRLVGQQEGRAAHQADGDQGTLLHATRKLVWVGGIAVHRGGDADLFHHGQDALLLASATGAVEGPGQARAGNDVVQSQSFPDLLADREGRVQRDRQARPALAIAEEAGPQPVPPAHPRQRRALIARFSSGPYCAAQLCVAARRQLARTIDRGDALLAIEIPAGFARKLLAGQTAPVQAIVDGTDSNTALVALGYVNRVADSYSREELDQRLALRAPLLVSAIPRVELDSRPWFNSNLQSRWFFVPGVIGSLILIMIVLLTAFAVVREREIGTLEQIMVTPIRRTEFILGKTIPFFLIGLADTGLIATVGTFWFRVPFRGSFAILGLGAVIFLLCMLGTGLLISTVSANQQQAMVTAFFFDIPAIIFSGFGFPISSMPDVFQRLSYLDPLRYFLEIVRGVFLRGAGWRILWPQALVLAAMGVFVITAATRRFRKTTA